ncbi:hypothetical protein M2444_004622 [Paenibacillus sp. PastF-3]|uniref:hypothetical protein n=1 Tax=unclassified Paenibacillus TaxID=185978 RepID=UPI000BA0FB53|nr:MULTISPECIES: hypothetical protein [unclassified Paenibacillus]MBY3621233.1 hypothetical protein [Acinetobacter sp. CUI P1]MDH6372793.1 hypothetical protein [Paenibacillus sp. PastF-3]OZQ97369.1 hypothetical protein CA598_06135 [Paenibacillus sp. VTT E-133291]
MKESYFQMDLFSQPSVLEPVFFLYAQQVDTYLSSGIKSAREIAIKLATALSEEGEQVEYFISGKPKLYVALCQYLEAGVHDGRFIYLGGDTADRHYLMNEDAT